MGIFDFIFGKKKSSNSTSSTSQAFDVIINFLSDERLQNSIYPKEYQDLLNKRGARDQIDGATGEFGRCISNPIPVNGPIGEVLYISQLTIKDDVHITGHRLYTAGNIDIYETVSLDGSKWDILFFDMYHTRKSRLTPNGYKFKSPMNYSFTATNYSVSPFPANVYNAVIECSKALLGFPAFSPELIKSKHLLSTFTPPQEHLQRLNRLKEKTNIPFTPKEFISLLIQKAEERGLFCQQCHKPDIFLGLSYKCAVCGANPLTKISKVEGLQFALEILTTFLQHFDEIIKEEYKTQPLLFFKGLIDHCAYTGQMPGDEQMSALADLINRMGTIGGSKLGVAVTCKKGEGAKFNIGKDKMNLENMDAFTTIAATSWAIQFIMEL